MRIEASQGLALPLSYILTPHLINVYLDFILYQTVVYIREGWSQLSFLAKDLEAK